MSDIVEYEHSGLADDVSLSAKHLVENGVVSVKIDLYPNIKQEDADLFDYCCSVDTENGKYYKTRFVTDDVEYMMMFGWLDLFVALSNDDDGLEDVRCGTQVVQLLKRANKSYKCSSYIPKLLKDWEDVRVLFCVHRDEVHEFILNEVLSKVVGCEVNEVYFTEVYMRMGDYVPSKYIDPIKRTLMRRGVLPNNVMISSHLVAFECVADFHVFLYALAKEEPMCDVSKMLLYFMQLENVEFLESRVVFMLGCGGKAA